MLSAYYKISANNTTVSLKNGVWNRETGKLDMKNRLLLIASTFAVILLMLFGCKKEEAYVNGNLITTEEEIAYDKAMGPEGEVTVVLMGEKQYYTLIMPDGSIIIQMYCLPPYPNNICATFHNVKEEEVKSDNSTGVRGTVIIHGKSETSDKIPTEVELPIHDCVIDFANNSAKFILD